MKQAKKCPTQIFDGTLEFTLHFLTKYIPTFDTVRNFKKIKYCLPLKMALIIE